MAKKKSKLPVPLDRKDTKETTAVLRQELQAFSGPLPPPSVLAKYNEIIPDAATRIMKMAEAQAAHRQALEKTVINGDHSRANWGLGLGFAIVVLFLVASVSLVLLGHAWPGVIIGGADIISLTSVFVYVSQTRKTERRDKAEQMNRLPNR